MTEQDIVDRLRWLHRRTAVDSSKWGLYLAAAEEIEYLRDRIDRLEAAARRSGLAER